MNQLQSFCVVVEFAMLKWVASIIKWPQVFLNTKSACSSSALAVGIGKWLCGIRQVPGMLLPAPQAECLKIWRRVF